MKTETSTITIESLTVKESKAINAAIRRSGIDKSEWIRNALFDAAINQEYAT